MNKEFKFKLSSIKHEVNLGDKNTNSLFNDKAFQWRWLHERCSDISGVSGVTFDRTTLIFMVDTNVDVPSVLELISTEIEEALKKERVLPKKVSGFINCFPDDGSGDNRVYYFKTQEEADAHIDADIRVDCIPVEWME